MNAGASTPFGSSDFKQAASGIFILDGDKAVGNRRKFLDIAGIDNLEKGECIVIAGNGSRSLTGDGMMPAVATLVKKITKRENEVCFDKEFGFCQADAKGQTSVAAEIMTYKKNNTATGAKDARLVYCVGPGYIGNLKNGLGDNPLGTFIEQQILVANLLVDLIITNNTNFPLGDEKHISKLYTSGIANGEWRPECSGAEQVSIADEILGKVLSVRLQELKACGVDLYLAGPLAEAFVGQKPTVTDALANAYKLDANGKKKYEDLVKITDSAAMKAFVQNLSVKFQNSEPINNEKTAMSASAGGIVAPRKPVIAQLPVGDNDDKTDNKEEHIRVVPRRLVIRQQLIDDKNNEADNKEERTRIFVPPKIRSKQTTPGKTPFFLNPTIKPCQSSNKTKVSTVNTAKMSTKPSPVNNQVNSIESSNQHTRGEQPTYVAVHGDFDKQDAPKAQKTNANSNKVKTSNRKPVALFVGGIGMAGSVITCLSVGNVISGVPTIGKVAIGLGSVACIATGIVLGLSEKTKQNQLTNLSAMTNDKSRQLF